MSFALISASPRLVVHCVAQVPFSFTLSADDAARTKPRPDHYQAAAERLRGRPRGLCGG
ncbi:MULTISPECIES: hypothetical protein [unclassified Streptomyces]|uniref:hypothetical protein n=1 Tax=unclassified Streptomyces TaxID=2593676 RepID=UPI0033275317